MMAAQVGIQGSEEPQEEESAGQAPAAEQSANPSPAQQPAPAASVPNNNTGQPQANAYTKMAIDALQGKTPGAAAKWLAGLPFPEVSELLDLLCLSPDEELPAVLDTLAANNPQIAELMQWIKARDPKWTAGVVKELRRIKGKGIQE